MSDTHDRTSSFTLARGVVIAIAAATAAMWPGETAMAQSVIDMPPPPPAGAPAAADMDVEGASDAVPNELGRLAFNRYGHQRTGATSTYGMYERSYRYRPYGGWYGWGWRPWFGIGFGCFGGAHIHHVGGGKFVGTLCH